MVKFIGTFGEVLVRSLVSILVLFFLTKFMGFKQISQLTLFDYIVGISIGSIAAQMAFDPNIPYYATITAMAVYAIFEVSISMLTSKSIKLRRFVTGTPVVVINKGEIIEENLKKIKYDLNDLLTECRINGFFNISDVEYAVMETDGRLSFLPKPELRPANPKDMGLTPAKEGLVSNVIIDGKIMSNALKFCGMDEKWLQKQLSDKKIKDVSQVLLGTVDINGIFTAFLKNKSSPEYNPFN